MDFYFGNINISSIDFKEVEEYLQRRNETTANGSVGPNHNTYTEEKDENVVLALDGELSETEKFIEVLDDVLSVDYIANNIKSDPNGSISIDDIQNLVANISGVDKNAADISYADFEYALGQMGISVGQVRTAAQNNSNPYSNRISPFAQPVNTSINNTSNVFATSETTETPTTMESLQSELGSIDNRISRSQEELSTLSTQLDAAQKAVVDAQNALMENESVKEALENDTRVEEIDGKIDENKGRQTELEGQIPGYETAINEADGRIGVADTQITQLNSDIATYEYDMKFAMKEVTEIDPDGTEHTYMTPDEDAQEVARDNLFQARQDLAAVEKEKVQAQNDKYEAEQAKVAAELELADLQAAETELLQEKTEIVLEITEELAKTNSNVAELRQAVVDAQGKANDITTRMQSVQARLETAFNEKEGVLQQINEENEKLENMNMEAVISGVYATEGLGDDGSFIMPIPDGSGVETIERDGKTIYVYNGIEIDAETMQAEAAAFAQAAGSNSYDLSLLSLMKLDLADGTGDGHISSNVNDYIDDVTGLWLDVHPDRNSPEGFAYDYYRNTVDADQTGDVWITNRDNSNQARVNWSEDTMNFGRGDLAQDGSVARTIIDQNGWQHGGLALNLDGVNPFDIEKDEDV